MAGKIKEANPLELYTPEELTEMANQLLVGPGSDPEKAQELRNLASIAARLQFRRKFHPGNGSS